MRGSRARRRPHRQRAWRRPGSSRGVPLSAARPIAAFRGRTGSAHGAAKARAAGVDGRELRPRL